MIADVIHIIPKCHGAPAAEIAPHTVMQGSPAIVPEDTGKIDGAALFIV